MEENRIIEKPQYRCVDMSLSPDGWESVVLHVIEERPGIPGGIPFQMKVPRVIDGENAFEKGDFTAKYKRIAANALVERCYGVSAAESVQAVLDAVQKIQSFAHSFRINGWLMKYMYNITVICNLCQRVEELETEDTAKGVTLYNSVLDILDGFTKGEADAADAQELKERAERNAKQRAERAAKKAAKKADETKAAQEGKDAAEPKKTAKKATKQTDKKEK